MINMAIRICIVQDSMILIIREKWAYWSKMIYLNRYKNDANPLYQKYMNCLKIKIILL